MSDRTLLEFVSKCALDGVSKSGDLQQFPISPFLPLTPSISRRSLFNGYYGYLEGSHQRRVLTETRRSVKKSADRREIRKLLELDDSFLKVLT